eukprot:TRINITY_DN29992_c0_g2_i4.p2 TRINITY_DN29992_c0_g2~~TRINITY_DN29992_c0_g2_i4.p2  ORF type:complete len:186 (+),score=15.68 TRINITY_DN29992_c0_g2_i4:1045-1602(+)
MGGTGTKCGKPTIGALSLRSPLFQPPPLQRWPYLGDVCTERSINGFPCNNASTPSAALTGNCSGFPTKNKLDLVYVEVSKPMIFMCAGYPTANNLNTHKFIDIKDIGAAKFLDYNGNNLGVAKGSSIYGQRPNFQSCPRQRAGPHFVPDTSYYKFFNIAAPKGFDLVASNKGNQIIDFDIMRAAS